MNLYFQEESDDCLRACIASLLDLAPDELPDITPDRFGAPRDGDDVTPESFEAARSFYRAWEQWLALRGRCWSWRQLDDVPLAELPSLDPAFVPEDLWVGVVHAYWHGPNALHAVLMRGPLLLHDPNDPEGDVDYVFRHCVELEPLFLFEAA